MVRELSARHALSREVIEDVAARTGGVPLFVEEVTRLLLERGEQGGAQAIPPTLQQSLMARLDRLGPAREVAQIGSVISRAFSYKLLKAVADMQDAPLQAALEKLADADILLVQGLPPDSDYRFKHALIQDAAYENLLKSRRQILHRYVAEILRDRFASTATTEPEAIAHHFTQAGLVDDAIEWWGKAGDQALRRSAFQEAISHLGKAIEMADKSGDAAPRPGAEASSAGKRVKLQTSYGQALLWSKGFGAEETKTAFLRAQELAAGIDNADERFKILYGLWVGNLSRGEFVVGRETAEAFRREAENAPRTTEAVVAGRMLGLTCLWQGDFSQSQTNLVQALRMYDPERDREAKFRFGMDTGACATAYLAHTSWQFGEIERARALIDEAVARAVASGHAPTSAQVYQFKALLDVFRGDANAALHAAETVVGLGREHGLAIALGWGTPCLCWARAQLGERDTGLTTLTQAVAAHADTYKLFLPLFQGLLAELEAGAEDAGAALTRIDQALALARETGEHWTDAFLHRIRGDVLFKRDPANPAPAEEAFLTAIAVAQAQKARSFELRAALSLGKLYHSTGRAADAHAALAPALEGFSPTPEFPEIGEAQSLLATLAETDDVKNAAASRQRRLQLQTSYGRAMAWSKGFAAEETKAAFARAAELAPGVDDADARFVAYYGLWLGSFARGELAMARKAAETFQYEAENETLITEAAVARCFLGFTCLLEGDFTQAQMILKQVLQAYVPERDREAQYRFTVDTRVRAAQYLAHTSWLLGGVDRARELIEEAVARADESGYVPNQVNVYFFKATLETLRDDAAAALRASEALVELSRERGIGMFLALGLLSSSWARARLDDWGTGLMMEFRRALAVYADEGNKVYVPFYQGLLAEIEAETEGAEGALARIDSVLDLAQETGEHWTDAFLHRIRGKILLKRDPTNTTPAENAFRTAIDIAEQQKARSLGLRAALSLAKLYESTGRAAQAHEVLAPALEGFSPSPEFPEVIEAQTLLAALPS